MAASPISTKGGDAGRSLTFLSSSMSKGILNMNNEKEVLFSVSHLKKYFQVGKNATLKAVDDVSFEIYKGETLGMVGESGCGKTTCGRTCIGLYSRTDGEVLFKGKDPQKLTGKEKQNYKKICLSFGNDLATQTNANVLSENYIFLYYKEDLTDFLFQTGKEFR